MTDATLDLSARKDAATRHFRRKQTLAVAIPAVILMYLVYVFFAFNVLGLADRARLDNAKTLVRDTYSYKTHVTLNNRSGALTIAKEGERPATYPEGESPDWVVIGEDSVQIALDDGHRVSFLPDQTAIYHHPDFGDITARLVSGEGVVIDVAEADMPDWISYTSARLDITTDAGRLTMTRSRTEAFRYFFGWELFWYTLDSPYYDQSPLRILFGPRLDPERPNIVGALQDFWNNPLWHHKLVFWAIGETILMAFLGTMGAAMVALPLAFLAAKNFTPSGRLELPLLLGGVGYVLSLLLGLGWAWALLPGLLVVAATAGLLHLMGNPLPGLGVARFFTRRVFDFVRGVDALIFTILLSRAFGPGPLTGALAILLTDSGSFGKLFSEALENVDKKQIEGVTSTGARPLQRYRFGVIPQIMPVLISQVLYFLESNTRSATVIGAITGGGIGLMLTQAIITQKDWEEVTYYILLVVLMVIFMDWVSGHLRRRLIRGSESGH